MNRFLTVSALIASTFAAATSLSAQHDDTPSDTATIVGGILEGIGDDAIGSSIQIEAVADDGDGPVRVFSIGNGGVPGVGISRLDPMSLVGVAQIQKELELVDDQQAQLRKIQSELSSKLSARMREMVKKDGGKFRFDPEAMAQWTEEMKDLKADAEEQIDELLLPHQRDRLRQLAYHVELKQSGAKGALVEGQLAEALELTEEQKERLRDKAEKIEKDLAAEIARLQAKAKSDLFGELTPQQQNKLEELLGDDFDYQPTDWRSRIRAMHRRSQP